MFWNIKGKVLLISGKYGRLLSQVTLVSDFYFENLSAAEPTTAAAVFSPVLTDSKQTHAQ